MMRCHMLFIVTNNMTFLCMKNKAFKLKISSLSKETETIKDKNKSKKKVKKVLKRENETCKHK